MFDTLISRVKEYACQSPDKDAIAFKAERITYNQLYKDIERIAGRLLELGITKGDMVPFSAVSKPEMISVYLGIHYIGAVAVFVDKIASPDTVAYIYKDVNAKVIFTDKQIKGHDECNVYSLRKLYSDESHTQAKYEMPQEDELAELIYTSGTTGNPKGCMLTYKSIYNIWNNTISGVGIMNSDDVILLPLPLNHSFALRVLRAGIYLGATIVLQNGFTFAKDIENNLNAFECTSIAIVPASVETISRQMQDKFAEVMSRFKYIEVSAGSLTVEQRKRLTKILPNTTIINSWGSSESGGALFLNVSKEARNGDKITALGKPLDNVEIQTLDENGNTFKSDELNPGRMAIKGEMQMVGYWNKPELTAQTIKDGWLLTGDMVYLDSDGYLYMLGRADDIINVGGEKVSPIEVENISGEYPDIAECACIGVPDPEGILGFVPVLYVVTKSNSFDEDEYKKYMASKVEKYKIPVQCIEVISLPRNSMQKIDRKSLKELWKNKENGVQINDVIRTLMTRRSVRRFTEEIISKEILETILTTGYYAPTGHNMQTWKFTVITKKKALEELKEKTKITAEANQVYFYGWENPTAIVLISNDSRNQYGCQDSSCAAENIMLAAWSYGIGSVWLNPMMKLRNEEPLKSLLDGYGVPVGHTIWAAIALGYPAADGVLLKKKSDVINWIERE